MPYTEVSIEKNQEICPGIWSMTLPFTTPAKPGQFFMLRARYGGGLLPRAISVCHWDGTEITFCYQVVGRGTGELSWMRPGDSLCLTGPLGNGFPLEDLSGSVALVAGGIGVAPMVYAAKALAGQGNPADCFAGFRDEPFLTGELEESAGQLRIATESGRTGTKGFVTALLRPGDYDAVLCCGPMPMMKAVTELCVQAGTPVYVSLENKMACGVGGCLVCTCTDKLGHNRRTCTDGPVFRGEEINFEA